MDRTIEIDGVAVHVEGDGRRTIVMLHGWPDTWRLWDGQVAALKHRWRCVRFTLPGFDIARGRRAMSADAMCAFLGEVCRRCADGEPVTLLLHDWGCVFGYEFAMRHPDRVERLVGVDVGDATSRELARSLTLKSKAMVAGYQGWLALAWRLGGPTGDRMTRWMARQLRCPSDAQAIHAGMDYPYDMRWTGSHGGLRGLLPLDPPMPMLYLYGRHKPFMFHSPAWLKHIAAMPRNRVVGLPTGHWVMSRRPDEFNAALLQWLADTERDGE